jgi:hypothetical protein
VCEREREREREREIERERERAAHCSAGAAGAGFCTHYRNKVPSELKNRYMKQVLHAVHPWD